MHRSDTTPLLDIAVFYTQSIAPFIKQNELDMVRSLMQDYITGKIKYKECKDGVFTLIGSYESVDKVYEILNVPKEPLTEYSETNEDNAMKKRVHSWTPDEDRRLLCGITKYGLSDWAEVSKFIGNGRTRSQCSQRWHRSLNPRICKERWMPDDDERLLQYVNLYGDHAWTKVAQAFGCRTDVQCRYRYQLISKKKQAQTVKRAAEKQQAVATPQPPTTLFPDALPIIDKPTVSQNMNNQQFMSIFASHGSNYQGSTVPKISQNSIFSEFVENEDSSFQTSRFNQSHPAASNDSFINTDALWDNIIGSFDTADSVISSDSIHMLF